MNLRLRRGITLGLGLISLCGALGIFSGTADAAQPLGGFAEFGSAAGAQTASSNVAGTWELTFTSPPCVQGCSETDTLTETSPGMYTFANGLGWYTTDVPISGSSASIWVCGNGGTYSQADEGACPTGSGHWTYSETFDLNSAPGSPETATGTVTQYASDGSIGGNGGPFTAVGPAPANPDYTVSGTVTDKVCGGDGCTYPGDSGETVLVSGTDSSGNAVSETDVSAADGSWSVDVPAGSYTAGPSEDGTTFGPPGFDPKSQSVSVSDQDVNGVDFVAPTYKLSGTATGTSCSGSGAARFCKEAPFGDVTVLVTGTATDGNAVDVTDDTATADGTWSVEVPAGSYVAGPSDDDETFDLPGFSPDPTATLDVTADKPGVDFRSCAGPTDDVAHVSGTDLRPVPGVEAPHTAAREEDAGSDLPNACTSVYTITVGGRIPAPHETIVDPGPGARFNENDDGSPDYRESTSLFRNLDSFTPQAPACMSKTLADRYGSSIEWYSYIRGPVNLPKYTVRVAYNQHTDLTSIVGAPEAGEAAMEKVWVWHSITNTHRAYGRCSLTAEIPFMYLPVPEGDGFTIIVAWGFPFEPTGVLGSLEKNEYVEAVEQLQKEAPAFVTTYRREIESQKFIGWLIIKELRNGFLLHLLTGGEATISLLGKVQGELEASDLAPQIINDIAAGSTTLVHQGAQGLALKEELEHYFTNLSAFESGEAIMSAVIHGDFDTITSKKTRHAVVGTSLGITVKQTGVPVLSLSVSRSAYTPAGQTWSPFTGPLPWKDVLAGSKTMPYTANPYSANAPLTIGDPFPFDKNIGSGESAVDNLTAATHALPAVNEAIHEGGLYQNLPAEESSAPDVFCPRDYGSLGLELSTAAYDKTTHSICWLFKDGDA
jgi:hypothetical protein